MADDVGEMRVMKSKKSVNFGGAFHQAVEEPHAAASASVQRSGISRRDKGTSSLAGLLVGGEGGGGVAQSTASMSAAKKARKRRRMWRRIMQRFSPAYWLHVLDKKLPILHPEATGRVAWDFFMLALVVYVCFMEPYNIGFGYFPLDLTPILPDPPAGPATPPDAPMPPPFAPTAPPMPAFLPDAQDDAWEKARLGLEDWNWAIDAFFWMDLLSNFRTAYVDATATLIRSGAEIAKHYLRTWFPIDLMACIPFTEIVLLFTRNLSSAQLSALMLLRTLRLLRLARLLRVLERMKKGNLIRLLKLLFFIMLVVHWLTCLWFFIYRLLRDTVNLPWTFDLQLGDHPATFTYFLQGYMNTFVLMIGNDVQPGNDIEKIFACFVLGMGACFYAIVMGSISLLVNNLDPTAARHRLKRDIINNAIRYLGIKGKVVGRVSQYFDYLLQRNHPGPDGMQAISQLPSSMFRDISSAMYEGHVKKVPLFKDCEEAFIRHLVMRLRLQVYLEGEIVFRMGDVGHEMYFITKGNVAVLNTYKELLAVLGAGGFFGELGLLATAHRTAHCVALSDCDLNLLVANDLMNAMNNFPDSARIVRERAIKRLSELQTAGKADVHASDAPRHLAKFGNAPAGLGKHEESFNQGMAGGRSGAYGTGTEGSGAQASFGSAHAMMKVGEPLIGTKIAEESEAGDEEKEFSQEDTMALLERVTMTVSQITARLEAVHSGIYDINGRLVKVDTAPGPNTEFGAPAGASNLDMGLDLDGY